MFAVDYVMVSCSNEQYQNAVFRVNTFGKSKIIYDKFLQKTKPLKRVVLFYLFSSKEGLSIYSLKTLRK